MLIRIFKSNQKVINVIGVLWALILWLPAFFLDQESTFPILCSTSYLWLDVLIGVLLLSLQSIYLNVIVDRYKLLKKNSHLTGLIFILLNSYGLLFLQLNQLLVANIFLLIVFHQLLRLYQSEHNYGVLFNTGFLVSIATLIYPPAVLYFGLIWMVLIYTSTPKWRDFVISLMGFSIPIIYYFSYQFVVVGWDGMNSKTYLTSFFNLSWNDLLFFTQLNFMMLGGVVMLALLTYFMTLNNRVVKERKHLVVVLLLLGVGMATMLLNQFDFLATFLVISLPLSIIVANYFQQLKREWLAELLFLTLFVVLVMSYFL